MKTQNRYCEHALEQFKGEALVKSLYDAIHGSKYWEESAFLIVFDEHGGFFDHVIPSAANLQGASPLIPEAPISLTRHNFRFDRYGLRVSAIVVSPYIRQATIDHTCYDHVSIARTLMDIARPGSKLLLLSTRSVTHAAGFGGVFNLSQPRPRSDIPPCPSALPVPQLGTPATLGKTVRAFSNLQ